MAVRKRRKMKEITPKKWHKRISLTGFYIEQELLRAKGEGKHQPIEEEALNRIAKDCVEMFGKAVNQFEDEKSAFARVKRDLVRLERGGWHVRSVRAVVTPEP